MMKKLLTFLLFAALLCGCRQKDTFCIEGNITGAADTVLYLEHLTLGDGIIAIDSIRLKEDGAFCFRKETVGNPEFYRLRIGGQGINLAIDSTETVRIKADIENMSFGYEVEGSSVCDTIHLLSLKLADLERQIRRVSDDRNYTIQERSDMIEQLIRDYKTDVEMEIIQNRYGATYSYFACFQMLGGRLLFNPMNDKNDLAWIRAVANAWDQKYPGCQRTQNLFNIVTEARRNQTPSRKIVLNIDGEKVKELGIIDMTFPDINGTPQTLSNLKGKVILLDFTAFCMEGNQERTLQLRELYNKYHTRGFEIYQVSIDPDRHFWTQRCEHLPWVCVYCEEGLDSDMLKLYQVQELPTYFLIDRNCDLQLRMETTSDIRKAIEALL
ncbi:MAG: AhpC/TSA family protein [Bacteroidaceae bacterium]|nr:AhpC/TSA family protein [Bacteroidaceae bacterium]